MRGRSGAPQDSMAPSEINEKSQVLGRQIWRVVPYAKRYPGRVLSGVLGNATARFFDLMPFVAIGLAVDYFTGGGLSGPQIIQDFVTSFGGDPAIGYGVLIFLGFFCLAIFQGISEYSWQTLGYKIQHDLRMDATRSLIAMEASYYDMRQTGQIMSVLSSDVNQLEDVVSDSSTSIIRIVVTFLTAFLILVFMSWKLAIVLFGPIILIVPIVYWFSTSVQRKYRKQRESTGDITAVLENLISGIAVVQAYNAEAWEAQRVERESGSYKEQAMEASKDRNRFVPMIYVVAGIAFGLLVTAGGWLAKEGEITTGQLVTFLLISTRMTMPMFIFGILVNQLQRGEAAARRVFAAIDLEPTIVDADDATALLGPIETIEFKDVHFTYPNTSTKVLSGISFSVAGGQFLGVMGHTGAGKTTILKLLMRYYVPDSGEVLINGNDINNFTLESVRDAIGFVSQDPFLFYGTIRDNVRYNQEATEEDLSVALELAGALEFVKELEDGMETMVGDRGAKLSGGQRARVSLARALLKKPSLLILDEASSALDAETERRIQENLLSTGSGRATIAVAHRLSTIRNANEILAMVDGAVVERGKHDELLEHKGVYSSQWIIQTGDMAGL
ncbi:ABC transporter ATP-binding protein/permease [bacterium]|nr:ABC transporter ATP-binding protein/permease [Candidatus Poseidoniales archaeon]MDB3879297.1 ABC transporter ATP-binding protein/permease [bacterium]MDC3316965.1 ABC transporter ATP-binding protein/permease [Candidatus Poseidoniaceae archaeon]MDA8716237.1 ABC transporter ATP-binding protein/permease [Candidatus Poseidoniales archaeon]MDA8718115.1 ABC transporter ATP-binding protein/permease [Candidatus Poseidoniales archaeon]